MTRAYAEVQRPEKKKQATGTNTPMRPAAREALSDAVNKLIRAELDAAIRERGVSDKEMERRTGIPSTTIRRIITGFISSPPLDKVAALYDALGMEMPNTRKMRPKFTLPELVIHGAALLSYPRIPTSEDKTKVESLLRALVDADVVNVSSP